MCWWDCRWWWWWLCRDYIKSLLEEVGNQLIGKLIVLRSAVIAVLSDGSEIGSIFCKCASEI